MDKVKDIKRLIELIINSPEHIKKIAKTGFFENDSHENSKISNAILAVENKRMLASIAYNNDELASIMFHGNGNVVIVGDDMFYLSKEPFGGEINYSKIDYSKEDIYKNAEDIADACKTIKKTHVSYTGKRSLFGKTIDDEVVIKTTLEEALKTIKEYQRKNTRISKIWKNIKKKKGREPKMDKGNGYVSQIGRKQTALENAVARFKKFEIDEKKAIKDSKREVAEGKGIEEK